LGRHGGEDGTLLREWDACLPRHGLFARAYGVYSSGKDVVAGLFLLLILFLWWLGYWYIYEFMDID